MIDQQPNVWFGLILGQATLAILKILKLPSSYSDNFQIFKNSFGQFIPNRPSEHVITITNALIRIGVLKF